MEIIVNGNPRACADGQTVSGLLDELGLGEKRVAVERNGELVPKSLHAEQQLGEGDQIEIVHAIGGG
ncbi:MAG: sulfur carrier protein ThiS [Wenzhouxiangella sp.]|nr:MAG: sulfur carrier protein ThiS [Wenzhouxiangella sp.]